MTVIAHLGPAFLRSVEAASARGQNAALVSAARQLISELNGRPGDGALAVYRDLDSNIEGIEQFLARFESADQEEALIGNAHRIHSALTEMRTLVQNTPPDVMDAIKGRLKAEWGTPDEKYHSSIGTPVMYVATAAVLVARWFGFWPVSWLVVVPAALLAGAVAAAVVSTLIKSVRGY